MASHKRSFSLGTSSLRKSEEDGTPTRKYRRLSIVMWLSKLSPWNLAPLVSRFIRFLFQPLQRPKDISSRNTETIDVEKAVYESGVKEKLVLPEPMFLRHQLVGDSILLRFAEQVLSDKCKHENGLRFLGLCVSGQTIRDLKNRIKNKFAPIARKIILLIGTNDMTRLAELEDMICDMELLMTNLKTCTEKIVILTLPPVPKLVDSPNYQKSLTGYNDFLESLHDGENVFVIKITHLFLQDGKCNLDFFERFFDRFQQRPDLVHLNRIGLLKICDSLRDHKFMKVK